MGHRVGTGNETRVVFGGQTMLHARVRIDERTTPMAVDHLLLDGGTKGQVSLGLLEWIGDQPRFLMAAAGGPRPASFDVPLGRG